MTRLPDTDGQPWTTTARDTEFKRIRARRVAQDLPQPDGWSQTIGLALSGGGIRSATSSLGALQALARLKLLACVDVLSTVSGGGYIGAFFMSLFARDAASPAVRQPYELLAGSCSRPGVGVAPGSDASPGRALWWLRNSGRYLAPTGAGDYVYAIAMQIRNWFGLHLVLGIALLVLAGPVILIDALLRSSLESLWHASLLSDAGFGLGMSAVAVAAFWIVPAGFAFFACEMPEPNSPTSRGQWWLSRTIGVFLLTTLVLGLGATALHPRHAPAVAEWISHSPWRPDLAKLATYVGSRTLSYIFAGIAATLFVSLLYLGGTAIAVDVRRKRASAGAPGSQVSPRGLMQSTRVNLTKNLATAMKCALALAGSAVAVSISHHLVADWDKLWPKIAGAGGGAGVALVFVRQIAALAGQPSKLGFLRRIPLDVVALATGATLFALIVIAWFCAAWAIVVITGGVPLRSAARLVDCMPPLVAETVLMCAVGFAVARSFQFINMSTLQSLYASRLTRAYLGASNPERDADPDPRWTRLSDPHPADDLTLERYYRPGNAAPVHLINVTLNETVSPTDPLVQRDRHGRPMSITPDHYAVDGLFTARPASATAPASGATRRHRIRTFVRAPLVAATTLFRLTCRIRMPSPSTRSRRPPEQLSLGQWISISGAAFSTGVGRQTSLGKSLALGLANVRLGHWWKAGALAEPPLRRGAIDHALRLLARAFETQTYLFSELLARFSGRYARYWYLSDGGHFENLGLYELLRRRIGFVIACENGADPHYSGEDLANAMRLSRIDFGVEFLEFAPRMLRPIPALAPLADLLITIDTSGQGAYRDDACLRILWAYPSAPDANDAKRFVDEGSAIVMVKPRLIRSAPTDVREYASTHASFPQETTADQFFTEEQWESYRKLGQTAATLLVRALQGDTSTTRESLGAIASVRNALGLIAFSLVIDPRARIFDAPELSATMEGAAEAARQ